MSERKPQEEGKGLYHPYYVPKELKYAFTPFHAKHDVLKNVGGFKTSHVLISIVLWIYFSVQS